MFGRNVTNIKKYFGYVETFGDKIMKFMYFEKRK